MARGLLYRAKTPLNVYHPNTRVVFYQKYRLVQAKNNIFNHEEKKSTKKRVSADSTDLHRDEAGGGLDKGLLLKRAFTQPSSSST